VQILNPQRLKETMQPLLPKRQLTPSYAAIVQLTVAALTGVAGIMVGQAVSLALAGFWPLWAIAIPIGLFVLLASLTVATLQDYGWSFGFAALWGFCFALALPWRTLGEAAVIVAVIALSSMAGFLAYRTAGKAYTTLHLFSLLRGYASTLATGAVIALLVLYGFAVARGSALLPQGVLASVADRAARLVPAILPGVVPSSSEAVSVRDLALASARSQLENDARYRALSPAEQERVLAEAADAAAASLVRQVGVQGSATSSVGLVAQGAFGNVIQGFQDKYGWYFTIAWLLGAFFLARSAAVLLTFVVAGLAWVILSGAVALGILRIESVPSLHERLVF